MLKKTLVLLDGFNLSEVVFTYAQELAGRLNLDLELLHVFSPQEAEQLPMRKAYIEHMAEVLQKKAEDIRCQAGNTAQDQCIKAKGIVVVGYPAEEIVKYVEANVIDLVMLLTHGRSGIRMWDLGDVATKVIHAVNVPIWIVPSELREEVIADNIPNGTMVIPLDGSKASEAVIPYAINLAKQRGAETEMVLIHVYTPTIAVANMEQIREIDAKRLLMKKYLDDKVNLLKESGITARSEILTGEPDQKIINYI
jgi:nucleotide-binding universal stress UspA family protein